MRTRGVTLGVSAVLVGLTGLAGCASASPTLDLGPAPAGVDLEPATQTAQTLLEEVYTHVLTGEGGGAVVSERASPEVASAELAQALDLGAGAVAFAAATIAELGRADSAEPGTVTSVEVTATAPAVIVGETDAGTVATLTLTTSTTTSSSPTTDSIAEGSIPLAVVVDGDELVDIGPWGPGLDSGVGLRSATGAAARFVDLVGDGDLGAATQMSQGINDNTTELEVLAASIEGAEDLRYVTLPQFRAGQTSVVYALDGARVLGRFEVATGSDARVVYSATG